MKAFKSLNKLFTLRRTAFLDKKWVLAGALFTVGYVGHTLLTSKAKCNVHPLTQQELEQNPEFLIKTERSKHNFVIYFPDFNAEANPDLQDVLFAAINSQNLQFLEAGPKAHTILGENIQKDILFIARNEDGRVLVIKRNEEDIGAKLFNFFRQTTIINSENISELKEIINSFKPTDRIVYSFIPDKEKYHPLYNEYDQFVNSRIKNLGELNQNFQDLKYDLTSKNAYFVVLRDYASAQYLGIGEQDVGEIYVMKRTSKFNDNDTNNRLEDIRVDSKKLEPNEYDLIKKDFNWKEFYKQTLHQQSLDYVNYIETSNELENLMNVCKRIKINKFLVFYERSSGRTFDNAVIKLTRAKKQTIKDLNQDSFVIIATTNPKIIQKNFGIIPNKYEATFRFIDLETTVPVEEQLVKKAVFLDENLKPVRTEENYMPTTHQRFFFNHLTTGGHYSGHPVVKGLIRSALQKKLPSYFEGEQGAGIKYSHYISGETFNRDVIQNPKNIIIEFYKPTCPACIVLSRSYEEFARIVEDVQTLAAKIEKGEYEFKRSDDNVINRYHIKNYQKFLNVVVARYNIYNENQTFPSPSGTPLIFLFKSGEKSLPEQIDLAQEKLRFSDTDRVVNYLLKYVEEKL